MFQIAMLLTAADLYILIDSEDMQREGSFQKINSSMFQCFLHITCPTSLPQWVYFTNSLIFPKISDLQFSGNTVEMSSIFFLIRMMADFIKLDSGGETKWENYIHLVNLPG